MIFWQRLLAAQGVPGRCGACLHFDNKAATLEANFAAMVTMGSGFASVRAGDGLCKLRGIYLSDRAGCASFAKRPGQQEQT
jgi:hypothetical protein